VHLTVADRTVVHARPGTQGSPAAAPPPGRPRLVRVRECELAAFLGI